MVSTPAMTTPPRVFAVMRAEMAARVVMARGNNTLETGRVKGDSRKVSSGFTWRTGFN